MRRTRSSTPAAGSPEIAAEVKAAMEAQGLSPKMDDKRGWDHGVFVPMILINPKADVPVIQLSVLSSEDPETHLRMGAALYELRKQNIAIIGSGFASYHNMRGFGMMRHASPPELAKFRSDSGEWNDAVTGAAMAEPKKDKWDGFKAWRQFPHADDMHPARAGEHFMPLIVCAGAVGEGEKGHSFKDEYIGMDIFTYYWGADEVN